MIPALALAQETMDELQSARADTMAKAIVFGASLAETRSKAGAGEFARMFLGHPDPVAGAFPFPVKRAQLFMRLASNRALVERRNWPSLPIDFEAVLALAIVSADLLDAAIADGRVRLEMSVADANRLRRRAEWGSGS